MTISGTYVQVGMGSNMTVKVPFFPVISKQLRILGSFRYGMGDYPLAISLVERGLIDLKPLVSQVVEFEDALEAFETTRKGRDANGKVCHSSQRRGSTDDAARHQMHYQRPQVGCGGRAKMNY
jgi:threonine dehydrogenase-like Zn-dependent dehydrogenase